MAESQEELKSLLIKVKEEGEKPDLKLNMADSCWGLTEKKPKFCKAIILHFKNKFNI